MDIVRDSITNQYGHFLSPPGRGFTTDEILRIDAGTYGGEDIVSFIVDRTSYNWTTIFNYSVMENCYDAEGNLCNIYSRRIK